MARKEKSPEELARDEHNGNKSKFTASSQARFILSGTKDDPYLWLDIGKPNPESNSLHGNLRFSHAAAFTNPDEAIDMPVFERLYNNLQPNAELLAQNLRDKRYEVTLEPEERNSSYRGHYFTITPPPALKPSQIFDDLEAAALSIKDNVLQGHPPRSARGIRPTALGSSGDTELPDF